MHLLDTHHFHPWEGGEGKVTAQYQTCRVEQAKAILLDNDTPTSEQLDKAIGLLLEKKKNTTEGEYNPHIPEVRDYIRDELPRQKALCDAMPDDRNRDWTKLNRCFAETIGFISEGRSG